MSKPGCRHCGRGYVNRPRGLCWPCYYTTGVRELYPSTSKYARRSPVPNKGRSPMPAAPTAARPGTEGKVQEMELRAERGESLFHPRDAGFDLS